MFQPIKEQIIKGAVRDIRISAPTIHTDNEARKRSGHIGHALAEFEEGKIIAFNANTSSKRFAGHSALGWVEYRISEDYGKTFGEIYDFPFSKQAFLDGNFTVSVEKAVSFKDGSVIAFCLINSQYREACCEPWSKPMYVKSTDGGKTWGEAKEFSNYKGRIYDAVCYNNSIYVLEFCNDAEVFFTGNKPEHLYRIFKSDDNGETFYEHSVVPFDDTTGRAYGTMIFTPEGKLMVYAYDINDEAHMDCIVSNDCGKTWEKSQKLFLAEKIRNPQINILDGQYILHGRRNADYGFVIYTSKDGIHWDKGCVLDDKLVSCYYSNNLVISDPENPGKEKMLIQFSQNYTYPQNNEIEWYAMVNPMHMWVKSV